MGVRGLTTYINSNQDSILQIFFLHDSCLIIDGHSLCAQLYRSYSTFSAFGGDYDKFAIHTRNFFKSLRKCNITPYVLFDGSYETRKLRTVYHRLKSKINGAARLDPVTQRCMQIFPFLLRDVFVEVLSEMNIHYTVCEFEADDEIAAMARYLNCPVLSYDSDFFIYNVQYIPFNTLELKPKPMDENGNRVYALECKLYKTEYLTNHFGGLQEEMLPLLATLLGNDFVEKRVFNKFFSQLKLPKSKKKKNEQQRCIHGLFKWLQNENIDSAIAKILGRLKKNQKNRVFAIIKNSIAGYNRDYCRSLTYFNITCKQSTIPEVNLQMPENIFENDSENDTNDETSADNDDFSDNSENQSEVETSIDDKKDIGVPNWFSDGIRYKYIPKSYINLYTHHLHICSPQAEDYNDEDAFISMLPVLRYAFDILTDFNHESFIYVSRERDCNYRRITIGKEYAIPRPLELLFCELSTEQLKSYFNHFINDKMPSLDINLLLLLPNTLQLFMISLLWWIANCKVSLAHIHSLFICFIMLEIIDEKLGTFRGHRYFNNKYSKKLDDLKKRTVCELNDDELFLNKHKVQYEDCLIAASVLLKHFDIDDSIRKRPKTYDVKKIHAFAQFQCSLQQFNALNTLCRDPYEMTKFSKTFNGTFAYNVALKLENQATPSVYIEQYLKGATTVLLYYKNLCRIYERLAERMCLITTSSSVGRKRRRRRKCAGNENEIDFIVKGFESEVII